MFDRIISFSVRNKVAIGLMTLGLILWGIVSIYHLPIDAQPDITNNQVQIISQAASLGAQEVEQYITAPIELSMANIPGILEKRSVSRSGISVITLVFKDDTDVYWARQQVNEQLQEAAARIPPRLAKITLAPITTGLGEIYQYVLHTRKGYEKKYSATDLRTLQDWLVRTQLAGTPGVAEVSGWGGFVKQYEVALDNDQLNAMGMTIPEVFTALEKNNENTGGSYIEQQNNVYFIRGTGQVGSLTDIGNIVVRNIAGRPVLIRDIAEVRLGSATRYGAVTRNGEGEAVAGVTLMLKGENFNDVIKEVKARIAQIQRSLPEGVVIEPIIDRTELVGRAMSTVKTNLLEGALIVIFVLVLLLGNLRAGLIVASVIPLSMLFAFSMMHLFGVSGNLMSLGAIDFGLLVDGAVIMVEAIIFRLGSRNDGQVETLLSRQQMDEEVYQAASRIRTSAAFGELIILIVYLPLFALIGIEGKMFRPMAQTVVFAILGAFFLSLTYIPMMSALFLSKQAHHRISWSDRMMVCLQQIYRRALIWILQIRVAVVSLTLLLFMLSLWLFSRMGGEFIPVLEEGDLTVEIAMMQGTSLSAAVRTFSQAEALLKARFPEIKQAVTRIGSSEIPTDPMPMERGDMMLSMLPKARWTSAQTRTELMEKMEEELELIPGIQVEITQPMQMRFNELMTGIRQDVAIKLFGEDLDILAEQAEQIARLIAPVRGVSDPYLEKVSGLPQITVNYNRHKIAQYGLNISDVNSILHTAFAGNAAGVVFEGEKRFDLVLRLQQNLRNHITDVENLLIPLPSGHRVPLRQVADIGFKDAPAQVSREDGKRRIYVGFNISGRDVESTVGEIRKLIDRQVKLPSGYFITYGGQFQQLQTAKQRLLLAVPAALILILALLYLTFRSFRQSLLIFTAVPLAAMGGIAALYLRDMPFSISAGVGFIALFGVAVLNGIVLIGAYNQLKAEGITDNLTRVLEGSTNRLRPVLMTAAVATLGFLPMALSGSAGAEVQRPLATVVIGGLCMATFLTLFVLPCLYLLFSGSEKPAVPLKLRKKTMLLLTGLLFPVLLQAQDFPSSSPSTTLSADTQLNRLLKNAKAHNLQLKQAAYTVAQAKALQGSAIDIPKTVFTLSQDPTGGGNNDNALSVSQDFSWPGLYTRQRKVLQSQTGLASRSAEIAWLEVSRSISQAYYLCLQKMEVILLLQVQDSIYQDFQEKATVRFRTGETSRLELLTAKRQSQEIRQLMLRTVTARNQQFKLLEQLTGSAVMLHLPPGGLPLLKATPLPAALERNPRLLWARQRVEIAAGKLKVESARLMPDFTLGYSQQLLLSGFNPANISRTYFPGTRMAGFQAGIAIPFWFKAGRARVNGEKLALQAARQAMAQDRSVLELQYAQEQAQQELTAAELAWYQTEGLNQAKEQLRIAQAAFRLGEIGYMEYIQHLSAVVQTRLAYLEAAERSNQSVIQLHYLNGNSHEISIP